ncbi:hypothetical protein E4631_01645 [Hymenobacter sp. UV11]|uniref:hypothetical protein n=1 Tax=Hymenobacter sp. UV11 TaxID=1849735 RepID=UPI00105B59BA|nr:hypothetical protein [Hymenobacter sp. UV11]TDN37597.1 hypothetical protein A8B98_03470 [Hymenobacter sp. UV11]TFZ68794.1 hypothetical protein E4631_01645 [Hymenobacter sp. UV11]
MAGPAFFTSWRGTLPVRWRGLIVPYGKALGIFVVGYAGATAVGQPWSLGHWWSLGVPALTAFGVCWWLWRPWALLATNSRGELRRLPLWLLWIVLVLLGWSLRNYLRYRLGEARDMHSAQELVRPGNAIFFRLHSSFYLDRAHVGRYAVSRVNTLKGGTKNYFATYNYACPLLVAATDTSVFRLTPPAWLSYSYRADLGNDLTPGERNWRYQNFVARTDARFDSLPLARFTYLLRVDNPDPAQYQAVRASRLAPFYGSPLLLAPIRAPFAVRGTRTLRLGLWLVGLGNSAVIFLLLVMPLRPTD